MLEAPEEFYYTPRHMWVRLHTEEGTAEVGITEPFAEELPEILSVDMPMLGDELEMDTECMHLHLETGLEPLFAPLTGRITGVNEDVEDDPDLLHVAPMTNWIFRMEYDEEEELEMLLSSKRYMTYLDHLDAD